MDALLNFFFFLKTSLDVNFWNAAPLICLICSHPKKHLVNHCSTVWNHQHLLIIIIIILLMIIKSNLYQCLFLPTLSVTQCSLRPDWIKAHRSKILLQNRPNQDLSGFPVVPLGSGIGFVGNCCTVGWVFATSRKWSIRAERRINKNYELFCFRSHSSRFLHNIHFEMCTRFQSQRFQNGFIDVLNPVVS